MVDNYRNIFVQTAQTLVQEGEVEEARSIMDLLMEKVPFETIPGTDRSHIIVARALQMVGDTEGAVGVLQKAEPLVLMNLRQARTQGSLDNAARFIQMIQLGYMEAGAFDEAAAFSDKIAEIIGDDSYRKTAEEFARDRSRLFGPEPDTADSIDQSTGNDL